MVQKLLNGSSNTKDDIMLFQMLLTSFLNENLIVDSLAYKPAINSKNTTGAQADEMVNAGNAMPIGRISRINLFAFTDT